MTAPRVMPGTAQVLAALVHSSGPAAQLRADWQAGRVVPLASAASVRELARALAWPGLQLTEAERAELLADFLPWAEVAP